MGLPWNRRVFTDSSDMSTDPIASVSTGALENEPSQVHALGFFWPMVILVVVLVVVAGGVAWFWWKKKRAKDPLSPPPDAGPSPLGDWVAFVVGLPPGLRRVLSQFQPVFVLGDTASEKTEFVRQFSGHARRERQYGKSVSYRGEALNIYLGDRCVVIVPTDSFVESESARTHARWRSVIQSVCKGHGPRIVACLAPSTIVTESGMLAWARMIRAHADIITSIREQPTPLSVVIAQGVGAGEPTSVTKRDVSPTDCLFELLVSLRAVDGGLDLTQIRVGEEVTRAWTGSGDQRRAAAKRWLNVSLAACLSEWPVLFAQPGVDPVHILGLAAFFKEYETYTGNLGTGLAELFYEEDANAGSLMAESVYFLPWHGQQFVGTVVEFQGAPMPVGAQWHPAALLRYRLIAATVFMVGALGVTAYFVHEHNEWFIAVRHVRDYDAGENVIDLSAVRDYSLRQRGWFGFYDRARLRRTAVSHVREYLRTRVAGQNERCAAEELLSLVSLYAVGAAGDCVGGGREQKLAHQDLKEIIERNIDDWSYHTGLKGGEIQAFLDMSCPSSSVPVAECLSDVHAMVALPDLERVVRSLTSLGNKCELDSLDEPAIRALKQDLSILETARGPGEEVLNTLEWIRNVQHEKGLKPELDRWVSRFYPYRPRFKQLSQLNEFKAPLREVRRTLGPFLDVVVPKGRRQVALTDYVVQRNASKPEVSEGTWIRLGEASFDVARIRAALQRRSLTAFERSFERSMYDGSPFFSPEDFERRFRWTSRRSGEHGMSFQQDVPEVFTRSSFERAVRAPLTHWAAGTERPACGDSPQTNVSIKRELEDQLRVYLNDYVSEWTRVYRSFDVRESGVREALEVLARTDSPLRVLFQELTRQNSLTVDESFPFEVVVKDAFAPLEALKAAGASKAQDDYAGIIAALASELEAPAANPTFGVDFEIPLQDFAKRLTGYGRVALNSRVVPASSFHVQVHTWADGVKLRQELRGPVLSPVNRVLQLGMTDVRNRAEEWWAESAASVNRDVVKKFPFSWSARERATLEDVKTWLQPKLGRLDQELKPMSALLFQDCGNGCSRSSSARSELLSRLETIQRTLFTDKGEMRELQVGVSAVWQALQLSESRLRLANEAIVFKEQGNRQFRLDVPWDKGYLPRLDIEICAPDLQGVCERQQGRIEELEPSPWGFWNLLAKAERTGNRFTWAVPTPQGKVEVTYDVCVDRSICGSLMGGVFAWQ